MKTLVKSPSFNLPFSLQNSLNQFWRPLYPNMPLSTSATPSAQLCASHLSNLNISTETQCYIQDGDLKRLCMIKFQTKSSNLDLFRRIKAELKTLKRIIEQNGKFSGSQFTQNILVGFNSNLHVFVVLDYCPTSLADLGFQSSAVLLAAELVLALNFLYGRGVLHQDLKPANVMISPHGHIVIGGFGSSLIQDTSGIMQMKLRHKDIVTFTPHYAAPEINFPDGEGNLVYDERVDWWSLGVILYEQVTHKRSILPPPTIQRKVANLPMTPTFVHLQELAVMEGIADPQSTSFIRSLLQNDPSHCLNGSTVKPHAFFDVIAEIWQDIAALRHPPFTHALAMTGDRGTHSLEESNILASYKCEDSPQIPCLLMQNDTTETCHYERPSSWSSSGSVGSPEELQKSPTDWLTSINQSRSNKLGLDHTDTLDWPRRRRHTIFGSSGHQTISERYCLPTSRSMPVGKLSFEELLTVSLLKAMDSRDSMNHRAHKVPRTRENRDASIARRVWQRISKA